MVCVCFKTNATESSHADFIKAGGLALVIDMAQDASEHVRLYIADILISLLFNGLFFSFLPFLPRLAENHEAIKDSDILSLIFIFTKAESISILNAGVTIVLNILTISGEFNTH